MLENKGGLWKSDQDDWNFKSKDDGFYIEKTNKTLGEFVKQQ